jgi:hypothetical protein
MQHKEAVRYLRWIAYSAFLLIAGLAILQYRNDPSGFFRVLTARYGTLTPDQLNLAALGLFPVPEGGREAKVFNSAWYKPEIVVIGSSDVWSFVDMHNPHLRQPDGRPGFNFGLAGLNIDELPAIIEHVSAGGNARLIIVGLEFYMFNANRAFIPRDVVMNYPLSQEENAVERRALHALRRLGTIDTVWRSIKAEAARIPLPFSFSLAAGAPNHASARPDPTTLSQQRANAVRQADAVQTVALYVPSREFAFDLPGTGSVFAHVQRAIELAREKKIHLRFFLSPQHARTYEIIRALGRWPFYEKWLEELANQIDRANEGVACADRLVVLDYGAYKPLSVDMTEAAPNQQGIFKYFADSFHWREPIATRVIDDVVTYDPCGTFTSDFATVLSRKTLPDHLAANRARREAFAAAHPEVVNDVREIVLKSLH